MFISEDGTVTGSVDVSKINELKPKSEEAKGLVDQLKRDAELSEKVVAQGTDARVAQDPVLQAQQQDDADEVTTSQASPVGDESGEGFASEPVEDDLDQLRADAEAKGVKVDGRWGADRLREEIAKAEEG